MSQSELRTVPRSLPRGANASPHEIVLMSQRARLLEAVVDAVAEIGYPATTVHEITRRARVSRTTFYEQFANKEECFLVAYETGARAHLEHMRRAIERSDDWLQMLDDGARAYVELFAERPNYALTFLLEVQAAGERALECRRTVHSRYADLLREWHTRLPEGVGGTVNDYFFRGAVGAISEIVAEHLQAAGPAHLAELAPTISELMLALFGVDRGILAAKQGHGDFRRHSRNQ
jgi:AcrR family transcriptional regulator